MKLHFDSNQQYQWDALKAITDIFDAGLANLKKVVEAAK